MNVRDVVDELVDARQGVAVDGAVVVSADVVERAILHLLVLHDAESSGS